MDGLAFDIAHLLAGGAVLISFLLLYQDRMFSLLNMFALHALVLALAVAWQAFIQHAPHLYVTAGMGLVALSIIVMMPVTAEADPLVREDLSFALAVVLLGLLMMITRRNAVSQVVGFMSLENGLILAATGAKGMPLVVEISVAFSILIAFIVIGMFLFRIRERFDTVDVQALDRFRGERQ
jgi:hydrogenase-4 component E